MATDITAPDPEGRAIAERKLASQLRRELEPEPLPPRKLSPIHRPPVKLPLPPRESTATHAPEPPVRPAKVDGHHMAIHRVTTGKKRWTVECQCGWNTPGQPIDSKTWANETVAKTAAAKHYLDFATLGQRRAAEERLTGVALPPGVSPTARKPHPPKKAKKGSGPKKATGMDPATRQALIAENESRQSRRA